MAGAMRAAVIDTVGDSVTPRLAEIPRPFRVNDEFVVEVAAASMNPIDVKTMAGRGASAAIAAFPAVLGCDFSGVVLESPYEGHRLQPGDAVYGMLPVPHYSGSFAEIAAVPGLVIAPKPVGLSHTDAAAVPLAALTAWGAVVELAKAHQGQRMLIHAGSGGVGHFAVQFASYFGAHVIATGSTRNLEWLHSLGAAEVVDYTAARFEDVVKNVDVVIDLIGNTADDTGTRSLSTLRRGGLIVNVPSGSWPTLAADASEAGVRATTFRVAPDAKTLAIITRLLEQGEIRVHVEQIFELDGIADAFAAIAGEHTRGKLVVRVKP
ncbi:NADP-dependent oxidoreductase [Gryllotalpicola sp.]|uniref:NADP-dependent oxidoreductase n=1 Tax=Gryllotalpicola sp. TaxID=1932787 RepID=UPI00260368FD|nr:NADP-dependent oxidoreductase [Gryllotalpicola sp.]